MQENIEILLINDSPNESISISTWLLKRGIRAYTATNIKQGLEIFKKHNIRLVLSDLILPDLEGSELPRLLKNIPGKNNVPTIFFTSKTNVHEINKALNNGAVDYIIKSTPFEELFLRIRVQLEQFKKQEKLESDLLESENRYQTLFERSPVPILIIEAETGLIYDANNTACQFYGYDKQELTSKHIGEINTSPRKVINDKINEVQNDREKSFIFKHKLSNGKIKDVEVFTATYKQHNNEYLYSIVQDLSDRKRIEMELVSAITRAENANMSREAFLANMSHEIKTPLNAIIGFSELIDKNITDEKTVRAVKIIKDSGAKLKEIINFIIETTEIQTDIVNVIYEPTNILQLAKNVFANCDVPENKIIEKVFDTNNQLPESIYIDPIKLKQVLRHIIDNAIKFTHKGIVKLTINSEKFKDEYTDIIITIKDSGIGIRSDFRPHIFDFFSQQDQSDQKKYEGTGIGLSISKKLIELMNGRIFVESKINIGTTVTLHFPKLKIVDKEDITDPAKLTQTITAPLCIIDFTTEHRLMSRLRSHLSYSETIILKTNTLSEFEQYIQYNKPNVIIIDANSIEINGEELKNVVKKKPTNTKLIGILIENRTIYGNFNFDFVASSPSDLTNLIRFLAHVSETQSVHTKHNIEVKKGTEHIGKYKLKMIIALYNDQLKQVMLELNQRISIKNIDLLIRLTNDLLSQYPVEQLNTLLNNLKQHRAVFDISSIKQSIEEFSKTIDQLKMQANK